MSNSRSLLDELKQRLSAEFDPYKIFHGVTFGDPRAMSNLLREIKRDMGGSEGRPSEDLMINAIKKFDLQGDTDTFTELKYVCYGIETSVGQQKFRIIEDEETLQQLLTVVSKRNNKQLRRCFQGLLSSYFRFDPKSDVNKMGAKNWSSLKHYLKGKLKPLYESSSGRGVVPEWLSTLYEHKNLLEDNPCKRYADSLAKGNTQELQDVCTGLGIESSSWVWDEAFMAYVQSVCDMNDQDFKSYLNGVLDLINGNGDGQIHIPDPVALEAVSRCVIRYSKCPIKPEHIILRDTCVRRIGNPMLDQKWISFVNYEPARLMLTSWLKQQLIKDFFELLAQDGAADIRRLNYWLKWEQHISEMWFFLGDMAYKDPRTAFVGVRERMGGAIRRLDEPNRPENNAFVMRIGEYLVIEFSTKNNAMFIYKAVEAHADMKYQRRTTDRLKKLNGRLDKSRYSHMGNWESTFDQVLRGRLKQPLPSSTYVVPTLSTKTKNEKPTPAAGEQFAPLVMYQLLAHASRAGVEVQDNRSIGGNLWVTHIERDNDLELSRYLESRGFKFKPGAGYWRK